MSGKRSKALRFQYRELGLSRIDRKHLRDGHVSNIRRTLKRFWTLFKRAPRDIFEMYEFRYGSFAKAPNELMETSRPG